MEFEKNTAPLLKRAFMFLEDGNWNSADQYCERVLDLDPECAEAYLGKLMAELKVNKQEGLKDRLVPFDDSNNYQKAMRFADDTLKATLTGYLEIIVQRVENTRLESIYQEAGKEMQETNRETVEDAIRKFQSIINYKDSADQKSACQKRLAELKEQERVRLLERNRHAELARQLAQQEEERIVKRNKKIVKITTPVVCTILAFIIVLTTVIIPNGKYNDAIALMNAGKYTEAISAFEALFGYKDSANRISECKTAILDGKYNDAIALMDAGHYRNAIYLFDSIGNYQDAKDYAKQLRPKICNHHKMIDAGPNYTVGLKSNGAVVAAGYGYNYYDERTMCGWTDIVEISAGDSHTVGLKSNGTVVAVGKNDDGQCDVSSWTNIVAISAGYDYTIGLKSDGTVVAVGDNEYGECNVYDWTDIVAISTAVGHTVGLKADGTVVAVGYDSSSVQYDISDWTDIVAISTSGSHTVGLKADGTVVAASHFSSGSYNVSGWTNIVAISAGLSYIVGLKSNGTVVAVGDNDYGECNVYAWTDIVAVSTDNYYAVGLKADGTVVTTVDDPDSWFYDVSDWADIKLP